MHAGLDREHAVLPARGADESAMSLGSVARTNRPMAVLQILDHAGYRKEPTCQGKPVEGV